MKFKQIIALCRRSRTVCIYNRFDGEGLTQYIGDGMAIYACHGLPMMDADTVLQLFDVPDQERKNWTVDVTLIPDWALDLVGDYYSGEQQLRPGNISITSGGVQYMPIYPQTGAPIWIDQQMLAPITGDYTLYKRREVIAVKAGMFFVSALPAINLDGALIAELNDIFARMTEVHDAD